MVHRHGPVPDMHDDISKLAAADQRLAVVRHPTSSAVVLGSTQPASDFDEELCRKAGADVVRRRSGGGAVLVRPGAQVWIDLFVPRADPLFENDVIKSFGFAGHAWASAVGGVLAQQGQSTAKVGVAEGEAGRSGVWGRVLCFGAVGAAEVLLDGRKAVGISQRRDRSGAWFHGMALLELGAVELADLLADAGLRGPAAAHLREVSAVVPGGSAVEAELTAYLLQSLPP